MGEPQGKVLDLRKVFGLQAIVTAPSETTGGAYVEMDVMAQPGSETLIHYHPEQEETYQVLEGTLEVFRDDRWHSVPAGESLTVPQRTVHGFRNTGDAPVRFLNVHRPALAFQEHLETLARLSRAGKIRGTKDPRSLIYMSMSAVEHQPDVPVKPPQWMMKALAFVGRRLGYTLDDGAPETKGLPNTRRRKRPTTGTSSCPYSAERVEGVFSEVRPRPKEAKRSSLD